MDKLYSAIRMPDWVLLGALGMSLLLNVGQYFRHTHSPDGLRNYSHSSSDSRLLPQPGVQLTSLHLLSTTGAAFSPKFDQSELPLVIYVMSPTCHWCSLNEPRIASLTAQLQGRYRVIGLSSTSTGLPDYVARVNPAFSMYYEDPHFSTPPITLNVTPRTLIFSPTGKFLVGWNGAYAEQTAAQVTSYFHVVLPH